MSVARSTGALVGTDESTLQSVGISGTFTGSEVDLFGNNTTLGEAFFYVVITSSTGLTNASIDLKLNSIRVSGQVYSQESYTVNLGIINGTKKVPLGLRPVSRFMNAEVRNNDSTTAVTVAVLYELYELA
jgi:hypothetical protein